SVVAHGWSEDRSVQTWKTPQFCSDAVLRYGIEDVVTNLDVLERMQPSESLLRAVLHTKHLMNPEVL
ncbi:hypothetical protein IBK40_28615, partial [Escherichia coli]|nr:hypothetical protein [Escherichia coli]